MKVVLKLYASLTDYLPGKGRDQRHEVDLDLPDETTVADVIARFNLPARLVHLVLVNGLYVGPDQHLSRRLDDGDHLAIWPPIAGG